MSRKELQAMGVAALRALAKQSNVPLPAGAKKEEIINALAAAGAKGKTKQSSKRKPSGTKKPTARKSPRRAPSQKPQETPGRGWELPPGVEEPMMAQERVAQSKYDTGPQEKTVPSSYPDLPREYGKDTVVLMPRDPYTAYAYWEVTHDRMEKEASRFGSNSSLMVRVYDITGITFDGTNANAYQDFEISGRVGNRYIDLDRPSRTLCADVGLVSPEGEFTALVRSEAVVMARDRASDAAGGEPTLTDEEYERMYGLPGGQSSIDVGEAWKARRMPGITSPGLTSRPWVRRT